MAAAECRFSQYQSHKSGDHLTVTRTAIQKALLKEGQT